MKRTKQQVAEARKVYERMIEVFFFFRPLEDLNETVHEHFLGYGTAAHEFFKNHEQLVGMARMQADQLRDQEFTLTRKPVAAKLLADGATCLIVEEFELYMHENAHRLPLRLSTILEKRDEKWVVTHFHGSTPDSNIAEEEAFPMEGLRRKNEELEAIIKERTRELEIEAALERVRAVAMGMQASGDLATISEIIYSELKGLGFPDLRNTEVIINKDQKESVLSYYYSDYGVSGAIEVFYNDHPVVKKWAQEMKKASDAFAEVIIPEDEMEAWKKYREEIGYVPDPKLEAAKSVYYYSYSTGLGALSVSSFAPISEEQRNVLGRFRNVFGLAYRRYVDVAQAEAQAREAQIEAALERVRARTMGMHSSNELAEVAALLFQQVKALGVETYSSGFNIWDNDHEEMNSWMANPDGTLNPPFKMPIAAYEKHRRFYRSWKEKEDFYEDDIVGKDLLRHYQFLRSFPLLNEAFQKSETAGIKTPERQVHNIANFSQGNLLFITLQPCPEYHDIFKRFAKVFEQTYTRFLDLQKTEAQAREAEIQLALERVRARSMAMHKSDELADLSLELVKQVHALGVETWFCAFNIYDDDPAGSLEWGSNGQGSFPQYRTPREGIFLDYYEAGQRGETLLINEISEDECPAHYDYLCSLPGVGEQLLKIKDEGIPFPTSQIDHVAYFKYGYIIFITFEPAPEAHQIFKRFANVFEQTYTRFLDLQKAEAQAREAEIELALERVRARTMAMQHSDELKEAAALLFQQVKALGVPAFSCGYNIWEKDEKECTAWMSTPDGSGINPAFKIPLTEDPNFIRFYESRQKGEDFYVLEMRGERMQEHYRYLRKTIPVFDKVFNDIEQGGHSLPETQIHHLVNFSHGNVMFITLEPCPEAHDIFKRFGKVFEQTYIRFLDLQKAEAQAREAQIEASLERVRSKTMAMHKSEELNEVVSELYQQIQSLEFSDYGCTIIICQQESQVLEHWYAGVDQVQSRQCYNVPLTDQPVSQKQWNSWLEEVPEFKIYLKGKDKADYTEFMLTDTDHKYFPDNVKKEWRGPKEIYFYYVRMKYGLLEFVNIEPFDEENFPVYRRFAKVFEQTYTRFLDLKKAEAQAREARIEAALERVRAKAMAMHHSDDLASAVAAVFEELERLGLKTLRCGIGIIDGQTRRADIWTTASTDQGDSVQVAGDEPLEGHPLLEGIFESWKHQQDLSYILQGEDLRRFYRVVGESNLQLPASRVTSKAPRGAQQYYYGAMFQAGGLYAFRETEFSAEAIQVMRRFADVFHLAYTRYQDLQKAEARAREAEQQASLDRVRAEIASMRTAKDLERITPLIWRELTALGVPFFRCGVFIIDEASEQAHVYLSTPKGKSLAVMRMDFDSSSLVTQTVEHWRRKQIYHEEWDKKQFAAWTQSLVEQGFIKNPRKYQAGEAAPEKLALQFVPFAQGMLYIGSAAPLSDDEIALTQTLADAFAVAYARYDDFQRLEAAKAEIEAALENLKKTQGQLVQAEKMASLGQLTAGIAHEIKNPLNFVTNFAQLSSELIDELSEELHANPDKSIADLLDLLDELLTDLRTNNAKINEHGKRADSIVKSMMQHARGGKNERQPTELNALVEEYLNLTYHGMRARVANFNVSIERDFGEIDGKVEMVPQEIGRVLLNIMGNACDAVHQRAQSEGEAYQPKLSVATRRVAAGIEIRIGDNGGGISDEIREKIFEPFFTTKPTGSGTGLGLSLSYDIVTHGHGGTLTMESSPDEGASFIITLPGFSP